MKLNILCDANWESRVDTITIGLFSSGYRSLFGGRNYGTGLDGITIVLMCRDHGLHFRQRIRFAKKNKTLYMDVMLDLQQMRLADEHTRRRIVAERLVEEVSRVMHKYSFKDFAESEFLGDFRAWLETVTR